MKESKSRVAPNRHRDAVRLHCLPLSRDLIHRWQRTTLLCVWTVVYESLVRGSTPPLFLWGFDFLVPLKNSLVQRLVAVMTQSRAARRRHCAKTHNESVGAFERSCPNVLPSIWSECETDLLDCVLPGTPLALVQVLHVQFELGEAELLDVEGVVRSAAEHQHTLAHWGERHKQKGGEGQLCGCNALSFSILMMALWFEALESGKRWRHFHVTTKNWEVGSGSSACNVKMSVQRRKPVPVWLWGLCRRHWWWRSSAEHPTACWPLKGGFWKTQTILWKIPFGDFKGQTFKKYLSYISWYNRVWKCI